MGWERPRKPPVCLFADQLVPQRFKTHYDTCMPVVEHYKAKGKVHPVRFRCCSAPRGLVH